MGYGVPIRTEIETTGHWTLPYDLSIETTHQHALLDAWISTEQQI
jgi:hypothetical protein